MGEPKQLDLDAIDARARQATPGPWTYDKGFLSPSVAEESECGEWKYNGRFIAAARTDVPALVAEVRRLREMARLAAAAMRERAAATLEEIADRRHGDDPWVAFELKGAANEIRALRIDPCIQPCAFGIEPEVT